MSITGGVIQLLVLLLPVILTAVAKHNDTVNILKRENEKSDKAVANHDVDAVNLILDSKLRG